MNLTKGKEYEIDVKASSGWAMCSLYKLDSKLGAFNVYDNGDFFGDLRTFLVEPTGTYNSSKFLSDLKDALSSYDCEVDAATLSVKNVREVGTTEGKSWFIMLGVAGVTAVTVGGLMNVLED